ncbi:hypothetical protein F5Y18DRAFT_418939 [Xylariaceae sp. FL1019]|nr:hypothetical protein F5Y18DRAFT_418939 [Xylariaceae sp. FL1019]
MGTPEECLPPRLEEATILTLIVSSDLAPSRPEGRDVVARYHSIYLLHFDKDLASSIPALQEKDGCVELILRRNEVGCMTWIRNMTTIPSRQSQKRHLVEQFVEFLAQLHDLPWPASIGGLVTKPNGTFALGPPIEETLWQESDITRYWPDETLESMNALSQGPYLLFTAYITASCHKCCHTIQTHSSLERIKDMFPSIHRFFEDINSAEFLGVLDTTKYITAHKDLHFANMMCDPDTLRMTAILDWEFCAVVPAPEWDPSKAFLWNGSSDATANPEKYELRRVFEAVCGEKGLHQILRDIKWSLEQVRMINAESYVRAITEVERWKEEALTAMSFFEMGG